MARSVHRDDDEFAMLFKRAISESGGRTFLVRGKF
jgi:hypothetical protein